MREDCPPSSQGQDLGKLDKDNPIFIDKKLRTLEVTK